MKTVTKIGIALIIYGALALGGLFYVWILFGGGGSANPPTPSPWRELITVVVISGGFFYVFIFVGVVLIAVGTIQKGRE